MYFYILIAIILYCLYTTNSSQPLKETFTNNENLLGKKLLEFFKTPVTSFSGYLSVLTDNKNTSDNLISKGVYNKFRENKKLTIDDIMKEF